jgi:hypothetical protein
MISRIKKVEVQLSPDFLHEHGVPFVIKPALFIRNRDELEGFEIWAAMFPGQEKRPG